MNPYVIEGQGLSEGTLFVLTPCLSPKLGP